MQNGRWEKIEQIFNQAVLIPAEKRSFFIKEACRGDENLNQEVLSLLDAEPASENIFSESAFPLVAQFICDDDLISLSRISKLGSYKLKKVLGRGGMGAVLLAEDTRLERPVALKVLPTAALTGTNQSLMRFQQEAKAASSIFHHNVAHIYEFSFHESYYFLVMEYVTGKTLRDYISKKEIDLTGIVNIARQIADALSAAHNAGITHRDIKPENVIINEENVVKVLDFGLAKLSDKRRKQNGSSVETSPGMLIGTTAYMSPEQIRAVKIDERTDLWSLGVVLYEMLEGERPFSGETANDMQAAILLIDCPSLTLADELPGLQHIICKSLEKDITKRYQTAEEFSQDLKKIQRCIYDFVNKSESSPIDVPKNRSFIYPTAIFTGIFLLVCISVAGYYYFTHSDDLSVRKMIRVSISGKPVRSALSQNGENLAVAVEEAGQQSLIIRNNQLKTSSTSTKTLIPLRDQKFISLSFTPDSKFIYFAAKNPEETSTFLYRISVDGGSPQQILKNIESSVSFSPDGKQMVFLRLSDNESSESLIIADSEGTNERVFYTRQMPEYIPHLAQPSWSPDGKTIICAAGKYDDDEKMQQVVPVAIDLQSGNETPVFAQPWAEIWQTAWVGDGSGFIMSGRTDNTHDNKQLWFVAYPDGKITRLTDDFNDYYGVSVARKSTSDDYELSTLILERSAQIWVSDLSDAAKTAKQLTESGDQGFGISWEQNGNIVYGSMTNENSEIWRIDPESLSKTQLTDNTYANKYPTATRDGKYILFISERSGVKSLWKTDSDGNNPSLLVKGVSSQPFAVSPDGKFVYYHSYFDGSGALWRTTIADGDSSKMAVGSLEFPAVSPDGKYIATSYTEDNDKKYIIIRAADEPNQVSYKLIPNEGINISAAAPTAIRWTPDGQAVAFVVNSKGIDNIWTQTLENGLKTQKTNFTNSRIYSFDFSSDGNKITYSRGEQSRFVTLLKIK